MKKRVPRLKNLARRPFLGVRTTLILSLSPYIVATPRFARLLPDKTLARTLLYNTLDAAWQAVGDSRVGDMQNWEKYVSF